MTDWLTFEGRVIAMTWGDSTYTVLPLPDDVTAALERQGAKRVEGEINDHPVNRALIDVRLRKADPNIVETPDDVVLALRQADRTADWDALTAGKKRGMLHGITTAKRAETRQKRINALLEELAAK